MTTDDFAIGFGGPLAWPITLTNVSQQVLDVSVNGGRTGLIFHNPSATISIAVCPVTNATTQEALAAVVAGAGSYTILPQAELRLSDLGLVNCAWNGIGGSSSTPLTIWEFFG
jgi:hypothetical protein